ncbi:MAG: isoleucine--tRNA ligase [Deltaproteobacteria bacterium]|nr:isoleucine--tRNA ligase [Deltaproteobacteria bacterium]
MAFEKVDQAIPNFPELERRMLDLWEDRNVFHRSLAETKDRPEFVFYEGPPTANGLPHNGHVLTRVIKDLFPRYMTMRGYHVERRAGWDTHGLPVEVEVEKELRIRGREAILEYGVDRFAQRCLASVFRYTREWEHMTKRIGFWVDLDKAYVTYHKRYVESVWWALSRLFEKGLLYRGHKVVWWWAQGGTALSSGEVGNAYRTVDDPSVYVRLPLKGEDASLLVWTTTPWTLPSNMFAAVHADLEYSYVYDPERKETLVVARELVARLSEKFGRALEEQKVVLGRDLIGRHYTPPFDVFTPKGATHDSEGVADGDDRYWRIVGGDRSHTTAPDWFVTLDVGTGIVHLAPAFGEDDWKVWRKEERKELEATKRDLKLLCTVRPDGKMDARLASLGLEGTWVKDADRPLIQDLKARGVLVHHETYTHEYPFCWRSDNDPLIQFARDAWFIRTTEKIDRVIDNNARVTWAPEHIKEGRFGDFLEGNVDWALSRERFWGTPLNIWVCDACGAMEAPSSCAAIEKRNPQAFAKFHADRAAAQARNEDLSLDLMVHKPWIDAVTMPCAKPDCCGTMKRVPEVIDCWFDSGCMPFAQFGYPHAEGSEERFKRSFPADFISEAIDQTRGWFYSLMMISNLLFEEKKEVHPYKRCIVLGHVLDQFGKKESKSSGNYTPPEIILDAVRMELAVVTMDAPYAKGFKPPRPGEALIGPEDLDGLDLKDGSEVMLVASSASMSGAKSDSEAASSNGVAEGVRRKVKLRVSGKRTQTTKSGLPRRVVILSDEDRTALGLEPAPDDVRPAEVPRLPAHQRVSVEDQSVPAPGADAFRWFFLASNPPWNSTRHSLSNVRALQKELPIKLRNVYSFFVTYANIDGFSPVEHEKAKRPVKDRALLDRWVISELEKTKMAVVAEMDAFRSYEATQALNDFVEGLSNWYVRRSRDSFWAEGAGPEKLDAYWTLFQCLRDLALMIAPFLPFAAEDMYQNLVVRQYGEGHPDSVHLRLFPTGDASRVDEALSQDMAEVRALVSLGLQVRAKTKIKVRQPLEEAEIVLALPEREAALSQYVGIMQDELNVRAVRFVRAAEEYVSYRVKPNFQALGKRLGAKMKATQAAIAARDPGELQRTLEKSGRVMLDVDGGTVELTQDDLVVTVEAKEGFAAAGGPVGVVVLNTTLSDALIDEGLFREILSKVQGRRKDLKLDFAARISLSLSGLSERLRATVESRREELCRETLASDLRLAADLASEGVHTGADAREGEVFEATIGDERIGIGIVDLGAPPKKGERSDASGTPRS